MLTAETACTFVSVDPARGSWFALWNEQQTGGLFAAAHMLDSSAEGPPSIELKTTELDLVLPASGRGTERVRVSARRLPMPLAVDLLGSIPLRSEAAAALHPSVRAWAAAVQMALGLIARGRLLPWVSPDGWDTWRVDPLEHDDRLAVDALARAMPAVGHCTPTGPIRGRIVDPVWAIRACFDAVGDRLVRSPAAASVASSPVFAHKDPTRVRHLRPWVSDVAGPHCSSTGLVLQLHPPALDDPEDPNAVTFDAWWRIVFRLRSVLDPSLMIDAAELFGAVERSPGGIEVRSVTARGTIADRFDGQAEIELLAGLARASEICPTLRRGLDTDQPTHLMLAGEEIEEVLDRVEELEAVGVDLHWPAELMFAPIERRLLVDASLPAGGLPSMTALNALLDVKWEFLLEGSALQREELDALAEAKRAVIPFRGRWIRLDAATRKQLTEAPPRLNAADAVAAVLGADGSDGPVHIDGKDHDIEIVIGPNLNAVMRSLLSSDNDREQAEPAALQATLRPYQRRGLAWMADLVEAGFGGCLADDMGLGKTIQVLALHAHRMEESDQPRETGVGTLVVCPTSLLANWEREAAKFLPGVRVRRFHGPNRKLGRVRNGDIVITTYGVVRSDAETLAAHTWDLIAADEAQNAKNPRSRTARSLRTIESHSKLALTGTPIENRLVELWSIIDWTVPGLLGPLETFRRETAIPIEREGNEQALTRLTRIIEPFLLRRRKSDPGIAPELPAKTERDLVVPLTDEQISLYKATTEEALFDLAQNDGLARHGLVLRMLTALKQITNHPAHYLGERRPLVGRSGKLEALDQLIGQAIDAGESSLIFSQYVAMGELLVQHLNDQHRTGGDLFGRNGQSSLGERKTAEILHGGLSIAARQTLVDRFQRGELPVLVLSLKAGGTGLNLTAATNVIHYDRWWNPAVEDQATDRAYRIGQTKAVTVHRLITEGTVEDRVAQLLTEKRDLADRVVGGGGDRWISNLSDEDLANLVNLDASLDFSTAHLPTGAGELPFGEPPVGEQGAA